MLAPLLILATLLMKSSHLLEPLHITTMSSVISFFVMRAGKGSLSSGTVTGSVHHPFVKSKGKWKFGLPDVLAVGRTSR